MPSARASARPTRSASRVARSSRRTAGSRVKLSRPLDFLVVADHSDDFGFFPLLFGGDPTIMADPQGRGSGTTRSPPGRAPPPRWTSSTASAPAFPRSCPFPAPRPTGERGADDQGGRARQRPGPLHRLHRLRVDVEHRRQQPAPQRDLPRRRRPRPARSSPTPDEPPRQRQPAPPLEVDGRLRGEDRRRRAGDRPQRQPEQRPMFPIVEAFGKRSTGRTPRRGRDGSASTRPRRRRATARPTRSCRPTTSSPTSSSGTRATSTPASPRRRTCCSSSTPARRSRTASARAEARRQPVQVRPGRQHRRAHRPHGDGGGQLLRQDDARRSRAPSG